MTKSLLIKRICFSLCMSYKNHEKLYNTFFEKMKIISGYAPYVEPKYPKIK